MSVWGKEPTDYRTRYQVLSGRENLTYYARRRQLIDQGVPLAGGLNMFPPDKDASIITLMKQGAAFTTAEEFNSFLEQQPAPAPAPAPEPTPTSEWVAIISGTGNEDSYGLNIDSLNNVYTCGGYDSNPLTIYNINGTQFTTLPSSSISSTFIVKYNSSGVGQWATRIENVSVGFSIACDTTNNMYIGGVNNDSLVIYNSDGTIFVSSLPTSGVYIIKYNSSGFAQWAASINGSGEYNLLQSLITDSLNNVYTCGFYDSQITIYNSDGTSSGLTLPNSGSVDTFIVNYDSSGIAQWATHIGGYVNGYSIVNNSTNNVYICGYYESSINIYNSDGNLSVITLPNSEGVSAFIVKYDSNGIAQWATRMSEGSYAYSITCDLSNMVYVSGSYTTNTIIYNSDGTSSGLTLPNDSGGAYDTFIVKYDPSGNAQWATRITGSNDDESYSITTDSLNYVYISGIYKSNTITVYNSNGNASGFTLTNSGMYDIFIVKYDPNGNAQWATKIGGIDNEYSFSITCDSLNNVYVNGNYTSNPLTIYNSDGTVSKTISNSGLIDCVVVKYDSNGFVVSA